MFNLLQKFRMISGGKIIAVLSACALAAPVATPAAAYDEICVRQKGAYTTNGVYLRRVDEHNPEAIVWEQHFGAYATWGLRKCANVRGRMSPGEPFNIVQNINSGPDRRCVADGGRKDGTARWPAGGGVLELEGHGTSGHGRCHVVHFRMWDGCADDSRGGFSQLGCQDWQPEAHRYAAFDNVQQNGNIAYLRSVLERGSDPNAGRYGDETPLHAALRLWRKRHMSALLDAGADPLLKDAEGYSVVRALVEFHGYRKDFMETLKMMIDARVARGDSSARIINEGFSAGGVPAMIYMVLTGKPDLLKFALDHGGDASATTHSRYSPLHHAARRSQRMVHLLLEKGADPNVATRGGFGTPLHWTLDPRFANQPLLDGNRSAMAQAMVRAGGDPNVTNRHGQTPLHLAAKLGDIRLVADMMNNNGNPNYADSNGLTALHHAAVAGHPRIMGYLLSRGADPSLEDFNGNTAEELANR